MRRTATAAALTLALVAPAGAHAGQVRVDSRDIANQHLVYAAGAGERNVVTVSYAAGGVVHVQDSAGVQALGGCVQTSPTVVDCLVAHNDPFDPDTFTLGDGNDSLAIDSAPADAAPTTNVYDGSGDDLVRGGPNEDSFFNGPGSDRLYGRGGNDTLGSGTGADLLSGGGGTDTVDYSLAGRRARGVRADLHGDADDGSPGERDKILADVENLKGTARADTLTGNGRANHIDSGGGGDTIFGLAGSDVIDALRGAALVDPGRGSDSVQGGRVVRARDGTKDRIYSCGTAIADRVDYVSGCKHVQRG